MVWHPYHKGQKAEMLTALRQSIGCRHRRQRAEAHRLPRSCRLVAGRGGGSLPNLPRLEHCLAHINNLYRVFSKGEIEGEARIPSRMMEYTQRYGIEALLAAQNALRPHRDQSILSLRSTWRKERMRISTWNPTPSSITERCGF